jgi:hypothetical protein
MLISTKFMLHQDIVVEVCLPQVPDVGEIVNIDGCSYRVDARSWSTGKCTTPYLDCTVRVFKARPASEF